MSQEYSAASSSSQSVRPSQSLRPQGDVLRAVLDQAGQARVLAARVDYLEQPFRKPLLLSTGAISVITEAQARVVVRIGEREAEGFGSIYLSDLWAWPDPSFSHEQRDAVLRGWCEWIAADLPQLVGGAPAHPLSLGLHLHDAVCHRPLQEMPERLRQIHPGAEPTLLARAMAASPFDAAIHDAVGRLLGVCAMDLYGPPGEAIVRPSAADRWFPGLGALAAIGQMLADPPRANLPAWLIVGRQDDLEEDVRPWFDQKGYHCFKLKLMGKSVEEDVQRTSDLFNAACAWGCQPRLSIDTNEGTPTAEAVLAFLKELQRRSPGAFSALEYLEQPTARDIQAHPFDWHAVAALKPVLLDEGLTGLDLLPEAERQGWSGVALKTCKGHSFALVTAAWAHQRGWTIALQDLTNPGYSAVHAALLAAHVPTINGVELNSPQFTPAANEQAAVSWPELFDVRGGHHHLRTTRPAGLGAEGA